MDFNTTGDDQLSGWTEKKLQSTSHSQTCTKKRSCLLVCCLFDPLQLPESLRNITSEKYAQQTDEMHWKRQHLQPAVVRTGPILHDNAWLHTAQPILQQFKELSYKALPHLPFSPHLSPTDYHFLKHLYNFLQGKCFHNQEEAENAKSSSNPKALIFMLDFKAFMLWF